MCCRGRQRGGRASGQLGGQACWVEGRLLLRCNAPVLLRIYFLCLPCQPHPPALGNMVVMTWRCSSIMASTSLGPRRDT